MLLGPHPQPPLGAFSPDHSSLLGLDDLPSWSTDTAPVSSQGWSLSDKQEPGLPVIGGCPPGCACLCAAFRRAPVIDLDPLSPAAGVKKR
eukprot:910516-Heterocapsa_arctica.AAC.1